ncbi:helix-turn-helix transcriptional regulator [Pseudosulfitobacter pseudonitzschiae]|uniref:helix-turn-helix transcriptional regulator n=1 Tax=Pseudosulfitobacter pseudonitzschiae TaxID=1402135 RepID=UPI001AF3D04A|nr:helix-turn-helix transcriptional regulator [Pseudosulfitobacter pseudonitzschiae]MBM1817415.1 helix-turn-helix transcriptional regulator [Pseudosulfitobacter pseudonitzschiae]MBM1834613.1 helix-turn-helix transcriptional regulator [Pseudosulfitobacter pseudonitzschiae]MBM1839477.1 helix-turn-helix transcriptional regulator [Pseudosulfitobacter pseudonitzschiae]MBM1844328.1 helix-turn-helix transcriptional regulator [Pseudosulfitobacter pseudonitzschiae]MBM1849162.1 helix-turn-helix transcri
MKAQNSDISAILALKAARAVLGMTQDEVAKASGVSKPTVARLEAMLGKTNLSTIVALLSVYRERGVEISDVTAGDVSLQITPKAMEFALSRLNDTGRRRSDYKT